MNYKTFKIAIFFYIVALIKINTIFAESIPSIIASPDQVSSEDSNVSSNILLSESVPPSMLQSAKNLHNTVACYPVRGVLDDGTIQQGITSRITRSMPLPGDSLRGILSKGSFSVLPLKKGEFSSYPSGAVLFAGYDDVAAKFDQMIQGFVANPSYVTLFRKVHVGILNELYHHLMKVYVNFNLQHTGIEQSQNGTLTVNLPSFLKNEKDYATNQKTLIVNHLLNLIESQFNNTIRNYVPNLPQEFASFLGKVLIHNDYGTDLTKFLEQSKDADFLVYKKLCLQSFAQYLDFFQTFTSYLNKPHPKAQEHFTAFVHIAEQFNQYLYSDVDAAADKNLIAVQKMNPPLFTFGYDDIRALKMVPYLAKRLPKKSLKIMWPDHIVQAANEGILVQSKSSHDASQLENPIAYFRTTLGTVVKNFDNNNHSSLFICMRLGENLFEEELLYEPEWLSSWTGVVRIMRACFGDFSALVGLNILDPCLESFVRLVIATQKGQEPEPNSQAYINWLNSLQGNKISMQSAQLPTLGVQLPPDAAMPSINSIISSVSLSQDGAV